ncbi:MULTISPECIES: NAD(P)/FAD-dependent oxidoreductase [unclassified Mycolicibacterium]|uniref:NAD(P)/FAD-dependent oxidoreductase n=1 Tax=unclassified Mycolicibacterium TaxID=2636767 RepID=UPI00130B0608|nr:MULTISPECIES: NAD(P)/FAD-dependent oxidoreductase [unclassified Mycolicibacterium]MUL82806.1 NAD(P)/FAD-dependent oxidoreductase [Mycolicibacterium sp. CBMA 329]MUL89141.1 NAD(P)/FAD-dependent oxidoreductase [Mycolicibacterium sp. CBMA 331]MUL97708.1 NAD(P)/FAD-dependent oxidoreductase [Mycolicibacterium sp. CBMA 334]MUM24788.1 NAD(P)/FAD-dependent oxidoreductase [Mycolicibacterium sp. CBMA 295]MUM38657.1 NAD(P)/FAD-dependent oxidoreductase [Mycolicibacterium sp. CBMA 247]
MERDIHDAVVIGGGAAGLSAATVLARARRRVTVVDAGRPRNAPAGHLHGFLSRDGMTPGQLLDAGRAELAAYGGGFTPGRAVAIERAEDGGFVVRCDDGRALTTRGVMVAAGLRDELPAIAGLRERWGIDVLHCPYCHGYEVRDAPIAVLGGDNRPFTLHQAALVRQWSADVVLFPNRILLTDDERKRLTVRGIRIVEGEVAGLQVRGDRMYAVELADGRIEPRAAVFVGPRFIPRDELLTALGCDTGDDGWVITDASGQTSVAGVWAAGNVVDSPAQLISAAAAGSKAAIALNHFLLELDIQSAVSTVAT